MDKIASSLASQTSRKLIDRLREHGLDKHVELPQIAVMGDTSSGKSSVLTALSGITFPSHDQLTTRCPTQLTLSSASTFSGSIRLRRFDAENAPAAPPVQRLNSIHEVTRGIEMLTNFLVNEGQHISDDAIVVDVEGPDLPNLTLTDLPGLVRTVADHEDPSIIGRVRDLVHRYLQQTRTIILAVVPANVDVHNVEILEQAQRADPEGDRTLGVITKPDLVDEGAEASVRELLENKKKKLKHGYHMVRNRGQKHLNSKMSVKDGKDHEVRYFREHHVWKSVPGQLLGAQMLTEKLTKLLDEILRLKMPAVFQDIHRMLRECKMQLKDDPGTDFGSAAERYAYFQRATAEFLDLVKTATEGLNQASPRVAREKSFYSALIEQETVFRDEIAEMSKVELRNRDIKPGQLKEGDVFELKKADGSWHPCIQTDGKIHTLRQPASSYNYNIVECGYGALRKGMDFDDLNGRIRAGRGKELPIFLSFEVFTDIISTHVDSWRAPANALLEAYAEEVTTICKTSCSYLRATWIAGVVSHFECVSLDIIEHLRTQLDERIQLLLRQEGNPYTSNPLLEETVTKLEAEDQMRCIETSGDGGLIPIGVVKALLRLHADSMQSMEDAQARKMHRALVAYLSIASPRFVDSVIADLRHTMVRGFTKDFHGHAFVNEDELADLLTEDSFIVERRRRLREKHDALINAKNEIMRLR